MVRVHWRVSVVGNKAPGFQPYDTFQCQDGWVFVGVLGPVMFPRVTKLLGLEPEEFSFDACSRDATACGLAVSLVMSVSVQAVCGLPVRASGPTGQRGGCQRVALLEPVTTD